MPKLTMEYIFVLFVALGALTCNCQSNDLCQLKGYNLEPLTKSYWAVQLDESSLCPNNTGSCTVLFALCYSSTLCPKDAFACVVHEGDSHSLGGEADIKEKDDLDGFKLTFDVKVNGTTVNETVIEFTCDAENTLKSDFPGQFVGLFKPKEKVRSNNGYHLKIQNALGCKKREGLGPGSQFMIIILVAFLLYFGGGIIYNHVNGARGEELIPHHWFWRNLPSYVVDGCIFVVRVITCQTRENYSQNPDYGSTSQAGVSPSGRTYETL